MTYQHPFGFVGRGRVGAANIRGTDAFPYFERRPSLPSGCTIVDHEKLPRVPNGSPMPTTHAEALALLNDGKDAAYLNIGADRRHAWGKRSSGSGPSSLILFRYADGGRAETSPIHVLYHETVILSWYPNGARVVSFGSWNTASTRAALSSLGVRVGVAFGLASVEGARRADGTRTDYAHRDGIRLEPDGSAFYPFGRCTAPELDAWRSSVQRHPWGPVADVYEPALAERKRNLRRYPYAFFARCQNRQSNRWTRGNAPWRREAFEAVRGYCADWPMDKDCAEHTERIGGFAGHGAR